ncbi:MAG: ABC transporter ATP-binding protein [Elusimicrobiota bacterium]
MNDNTVLKTCDIKKSFQLGKLVIEVLHGVNIEITRGEMVALMGPSGAGKTTLLGILGCLDKPTEGKVLIEGVDVTNYNDYELAQLRNKKIGFVFQTFNLIQFYNARYNVELPLFYSGITQEERSARAITALERVGLEHRVNHRPNELSGGEQQRVAIARAIINTPPILIADEPTGNLDTHTGEEILKIFNALHEQGTTIILVTHNEEIGKVAQRIIRLRDGNLVK